MSRKLVSLSLTASLLGGTAMADVPSVAVDIAPVHSLVSRVMDGVGAPNLIIPAGASPHQYNLRPSEAAALQDADLVFWLGEDLTPWMEDSVETLAEGASVTALLEADGTILHDFREDALFEAHDHGDEHGDHDHAHEEHEHDHDHAHEEAKADAHDHDHDHDHAHEEAKADAHDHDHDHGHEHEEAKADAHDHDHDHSHEHEEAKAEAHDHDHDHAGHDHGEHDPHAWLSPANASTWLDVIAGQLSAADPENAGTYFANAAAGKAELEELMAEVNGILEPARGGSFVAFHDAYQYFEVDFDFPASGAISLGDATDPSPARIAEIQERVREEGISCVLAEPQYNPGIVSAVLDGTEANTAVIDPLGFELDLGPDLYPQLIRNMATALAGCM